MAVDILAAAERVAAAASAPSSPPADELGTAITTGVRPTRFPGNLGGTWQSFVDEAEQIPDLQWRPYGRGAVQIFDKMRTDPQIQGLLWGLTLPIRRYGWHIDPNGADESVVRDVAEDFNLGIKDVPRDVVGRTKGRFSHDEHLRHALLALPLGHMFFEQSGEIVVQDGGPRWRLRKLGPRMPHSIERMEIDEQGGLLAVVQRNGADPVELDVERLVAYVWEREASNWAGRSILRAMYGPWLIKQRLVRVDAIKHERNGMGIPFSRQTTPNLDPGALAQAQSLAESIRAGEVAGATLPYGFDLDMKGVSGTLPDTLASIRYCDEVMARSLMMMFTSLDQHGSRALGSSFIDYFKLTQETVAQWYVDVTTAHVVEDWVDWNVGEQAQAPRIGYDRDDGEDLAVADLILAIDAGLVTVSDEDETAFRERYELPKQGKARKVIPATAPAPPDAAVVPVAAAAGDVADGVMVALFPPADVAEQLALDGGDPPEQLHVTLAFLGKEQDLADPAALHTAVQAWAAGTQPLTGTVSGAGLFTAGPEPVTYLSVDVPALPQARQDLVGALSDAGLEPSTQHGFTPHMTLQYANRVNDVTAGGEPLEFGTVSVVVGEARTDYPLGHGDT